MEDAGLDLFVSANYRTVYYLTGSLSSADAPTMVAIQSDGRSALVSSVAGTAAADIRLPVETYSIHRVIDEPVRDAVTLLRGYLIGSGPVRTCGVESAATPGLVEQMLRDVWPTVVLRDAGPEILRLRKRKEEDEIGEIRKSLGLIAAAYDAARETIAVGRTELDVYNAMQSAVVQKAGTFVQLHGDFAVGTRAIRGGGPPTARVIEPGDLYVLDLFPAPALYFGDTCRTFAVSEPTDLQLRGWEGVCEAVRIGERAVRPGVRASDVYAEVKGFLDTKPVSEGSFRHHLGHGIGHHGHEAPRIIPGSEDVFEVGDVITLEPGIYTTALHGGIRLEDNYVVREGGLENLFDYPREL
jgi:Xaa-Pro aminopeptidase